MKVTLEIPDNCAGRFQEVAQARGLTVEEWLVELGDRHASAPPTCPPPDHRVTSVAELSKLIESKFKNDKGTTVLYRGHGAASFKLIPKVGRLRPPKKSARKDVNEALMLDLFRNQVADRQDVPAVNDWELLAIAQHHGMPTRLLDWTRNPLVALYFSVCKECETRDPDGHPLCEDAEVLAWRTGKVNLGNALPKWGPLKTASTIRYIPRIVTPRLRAQSGLFTVHAYPSRVFEPDRGLMRIRVPFENRRDLKRSLYRHGIHEAAMFPDLDGLARHIEWLQTDIY